MLPRYPNVLVLSRIHIPKGRFRSVHSDEADGIFLAVSIADETGNELEVLDESEEEGETITITFTATEEMALYYCEYHPEAMRGKITIE